MKQPDYLALNTSFLAPFKYANINETNLKLQLGFRFVSLVAIQFK